MKDEEQNKQEKSNLRNRIDISTLKSRSNLQVQHSIDPTSKANLPPWVNEGFDPIRLDSCVGCQLVGQMPFDAHWFFDWTYCSSLFLSPPVAFYLSTEVSHVFTAVYLWPVKMLRASGFGVGFAFKRTMYVPSSAQRAKAKCKSLHAGYGLLEVTGLETGNAFSLSCWMFHVSLQQCPLHSRNQLTYSKIHYNWCYSLSEISFVMDEVRNNWIVLTTGAYQQDMRTVRMRKETWRTINDETNECANSNYLEVVHDGM